MTLLEQLDPEKEIVCEVIDGNEIKVVKFEDSGYVIEFDDDFGGRRKIPCRGNTAKIIIEDVLKVFQDNLDFIKVG